MRRDADGFEAISRGMENLGWDSSRLVIANRPTVRLTGMIGRNRGDGIAMAFPRCSSVHTCFMSVPLDIAFIDDGGEALVVLRSVAPWRFLRCRGAFAVLERMGN